MRQKMVVPRVSLEDSAIARLAGKFRATEWFGEVRKCMTPPQRPTLVAIVDDKKPWLECLSAVLLHWPRIEVVTHLQTDDTQPFFPDETDIVLLDHYMGEVTGDEVNKHLAFNHPNTLVGSISTSNKGMKYARFHFPHKGEIMVKKEAAEAFVKFMNAMLGRVR